MGSYGSVRARTGWGAPHDGAIPRGEAALDELLSLSHDPDPRTRRVAAKNMCPCHLKRDVDAACERLLELAHDPDAGVRRDAVHALCDGSPRARRADVLGVLRSLRNDPDRRIRRMVSTALAAHRRTGNVNAL